MKKGSVIGSKYPSTNSKIPSTRISNLGKGITPLTKKPSSSNTGGASNSQPRYAAQTKSSALTNKAKTPNSNSSSSNKDSITNTPKNNSNTNTPKSTFTG